MDISRRDIDMLSPVELISLFKKTKDRRFMGELYQRYRHIVFGICLKYTQNIPDAEDAAMEVFELILKGKNWKAEDINDFRGWLFVLTKNCCINFLKAKKKNKVVMQAFRKEEDSKSHIQEETILIDYEEEVKAKPAMRELIKAVSRLPKQQRRCVELFYFREMSYKEVAAMTGYELKLVKSYIQNGKRKVKDDIVKRGVKIRF